MITETFVKNNAVTSRDIDIASVKERASKIPALRKVKDTARIIESLKALSFDDKHTVLVELKSLVAVQAKEMTDSAEQTLSKLKAAGL